MGMVRTIVCDGSVSRAIRDGAEHLDCLGSTRMAERAGVLDKVCFFGDAAIGFDILDFAALFLGVPTSDLHDKAEIIGECDAPHQSRH